MNNFSNTIAAISTPPGKGGVAIIRISGEDALDIASRIFRPASKSNFKHATPRMQIRGEIFRGEEMLDDGMATYFKSPASYTGEDTVEIYCHGGTLVTSAVLEAVLSAGATLATAGEFTRRAFINGKLSLIEAEAIGNLLEAESLSQIKLASKKSRTHLSLKIEEIRELLTSLLSSIYARIDYPDEDLGDFTDEQAVKMLADAKAKAEVLLSTYRTGKAVNSGIKAVICGKPNVGKSSLYNMLLGRDAAIVTEIEGTTRDVLSDKIPLGKVILNLSDTAGIRGVTSDPIEKIGIERSIEKINEAELVLAVFDLSREFDAEDEALIKSIQECDCAKIAILNKSDLAEKFERKRTESIFDAVLTASAKSSDFILNLSQTVDAMFTDEKIKVGDDAVISSARQNASLAKARELIDSALSAYSLGFSQDAVSSDIERALGEIAELDGRETSEAIVNDIFSKFCVGK
jgi:tRNA modification GTPase